MLFFLTSLMVFALTSYAAAPKVREHPAPLPEENKSSVPPVASDAQVDAQLGTPMGVQPAAKPEEEEEAQSEEWLQEIRRREVEKEALRIQRSVVDLDKTNERLR